MKSVTRLAVGLVVALLIIAAGYWVHSSYTNQTTRSGTIDVKELGVKLLFKNVQGWKYEYGRYSSDAADFAYQGYSTGRIRRTTTPLNDAGIYARKQIGNYYFSLSKIPCPCSAKGDQAYTDLVTAFQSVKAD